MGDDWHPTAMEFLKGPASWQYRVFVGFMNGGLSAVNLTTGYLAWAHVPTVSHGKITSIYQKAGTLVTSTAGGWVQAWDRDHGELKWERECIGGVLPNMLDVGGKHDAFAFACQTEVEYRAHDGTVVWKTTVPNGGSMKACATDVATEICGLALNSSGVAISFSLDVVTGSIKKTEEAPAEVATAIAAGSEITSGEHIVYPVDGVLHTYGLCDGVVQVASVNVAPSISSLEPVQDSPKEFYTKDASGTYLMSLDGIGRVSKVWTAAPGAILGPAHEALYGSSGKFVGITEFTPAGYEVRVRHAMFGTEDGVAAAAGAFQVSTFGAVERLVVMQTKGGPYLAIFITCNGPTHAILAVKGSSLLWSRTDFHEQDAPDERRLQEEL